MNQLCACGNVASIVKQSENICERCAKIEAEQYKYKASQDHKANQVVHPFTDPTPLIAGAQRKHELTEW